MLGYKFPENSPLMDKLAGAREIDIVYSGLEEIMVTATQECFEFADSHNLTIREAALGNAIKKLAERFDESGMMV